ncbi:hypothetical protein TcCL_Unassigned00383 [Trypanosoma cruzi]|nr:hypothetical protein TcCL_Unassigned00383 [Trypanosoma cruzi]
MKPNQSMDSKKETSARATGRESVNSCPRHPKCHTIHCPHATNITPASRRRQALRVHDLPPRKRSRSRNPVRVCVLSVHATPQRVRHGVCMCLCVWQRLYLRSSCAPQESLKKATAERGR